jgi:hypothetical protein
MKNLLKVLGLIILFTGVKAIAWVAEHGAPPSLLPTTTADMIGFGFVVVLLISFVACLIWYLVQGDGK